jgi:hypothetical protein
VNSLAAVGTMVGMSVIAPWVPQGLLQGNIWPGIFEYG